MVQQSGPLSHKSGLVSCNFQPSLLSEREIVSFLYFTDKGEGAAAAPASPVPRAADIGLVVLLNSWNMLNKTDSTVDGDISGRIGLGCNGSISGGV